eukprot:CAMPEP_0178726418 /NCGR_PEP_ID=MMETSP0699-20121125/27267_1 /TAXON_ID=265572 /ORGANISM="Extubocellulus spinifer, Strain CCMP396" /LENGTH=56 /DNA_ID=CAMNT_0020377959 /DNA_START=136 /DNA_END=303 /DNA_ORIENTATION=+
MVMSKVEALSHWIKVRSLAKNVLGSTRAGFLGAMFTPLGRTFEFIESDVPRIWYSS